MDETAPVQGKNTPLIIIVVLVLAAVLILWWQPWETKTDLRAVLGLVPVGPVFTLDTSNGSVTMLSVPGTPEGLTVIDEVHSGDTSYYLLLDDVSMISNVYRASEDGTLTPVTNSATLKFRLSVDSSSGSIVYLSGVAPTIETYIAKERWEVMVLSVPSGEEKVIGTASLAEVLPNANTVLVLENGIFGTLPLSGGEVLPLLEGDGPLAVSPDGTSVALYNADTNSVDLFTVSKVPFGLSYASSIVLPFEPISLGFSSKGKLYAGGANETRTASLLFSEQDGKVSEFSNPNQEVPAGPQQLIID